MPQEASFRVLRGGRGAPGGRGLAPSREHSERGVYVRARVRRGTPPALSPPVLASHDRLAAQPESIYLSSLWPEAAQRQLERQTASGCSARPRAQRPSSGDGAESRERQTKLGGGEEPCGWVCAGSGLASLHCKEYSTQLSRVLCLNVRVDSLVWQRRKETGGGPHGRRRDPPMRAPLPRVCGATACLPVCLPA